MEMGQNILASDYTGCQEVLALSQGVVKKIRYKREASAKLKTSRLPKQMGSTSPEHIQKGNES